MPIVQNAPIKHKTGASSSLDLASLFLRLVAGLSMILYNSWLMVYQGWEHLWRKGDWILLDVVNELGLPSPLASACLIAAVYFFGSIFLILGVFGRVTSAVLLVVTEIGFYFALKSGAIAYVELSVLYGALYVLHLILGAGRISLDGLLASFGKARRRRRVPADI